MLRCVVQLLCVAALLACLSCPATAYLGPELRKAHPPSQTDDNVASALRGIPTTNLVGKGEELEQGSMDGMDAEEIVRFQTAAVDLQKALKSLEDEIESRDTDKWNDVVAAIAKSQNGTTGMLRHFADEECWTYLGHRKGAKFQRADPANGVEDDHFGWTPMKCWTSLIHPYLWLFFIHSVLALLTTVLAFKAPKILMVSMFLSGLLWPLSAAITAVKGDEVGNIWGQNAWDADWIMTGVKWLIVDLAAGVPILWVRTFDVSVPFTRKVGYFIYGILGANIVWTLIYKVNGWVRFFNFFVGVNLTIALVIYIFALKKVNKALLEKINGVPYGRATPLYWLISYTIWNATFVGDLSIGITLQDLLFWAMMFLMQRVDNKPLTIDLYFAFARPLQLGTYIAFGCWSGIFDWFRDAEKYAPVEPLGINDDFYFLFITVINFLVSALSVAESIRAYNYGPREGMFQRSLTMVHPPTQSELQKYTSSYDKAVEATALQ